MVPRILRACGIDVVCICFAAYTAFANRDAARHEHDRQGLARATRDTPSGFRRDARLLACVAGSGAARDAYEDMPAKGLVYCSEANPKGYTVNNRLV
jgi:hypothetical protein